MMNYGFHYDGGRRFLSLETPGKKQLNGAEARNTIGKIWNVLGGKRVGTDQELVNTISALKRLADEQGSVIDQVKDTMKSMKQFEERDVNMKEVIKHLRSNDIERKRKRERGMPDLEGTTNLVFIDAPISPLKRHEPDVVHVVGDLEQEAAADIQIPLNREELELEACDVNTMLEAAELVNLWSELWEQDYDGVLP